MTKEKKKTEETPNKADVFFRVLKPHKKYKSYGLREILIDTDQSKDKNIWQRLQRKYRQSQVLFFSIY